MLMSRVPWLLLPTIVLATAFPPDAAAQNSPVTKARKSYHNLPFEGDLVAVLNNQLVQAKALEDLFNQIRNNPKVANLLQNSDLKKLGNGAAIDPQTLQKLGKAVKDFEARLPPEDVKALHQMLVQKKHDLKMVDPEPKSGPPLAREKPNQVDRGDNPGRKSRPPVQNPDAGGLGPWTRDAIKYFKEKQFADREQSASAEALFEVLAKLPMPQDGESKGLVGDLGWLKLPDGWSDWVRLPADTGLAAPNLGSLAGRSPDVEAAQLRWVLRALLLGVVVAASAYLLWKLLLNIGQHWSDSTLSDQRRWPCPPGEISTGQQLIQAFEHLAVLLLGERARTTNHLEIAAGLGCAAGHGQAALELAALYEKARYDPKHGALAEPDLNTARRHLCLLAGVEAPVSGEG
jgi:hypothetical protein